MAILLLIKKINQTLNLVEVDEADLAASGYDVEAAPGVVLATGEAGLATTLGGCRQQLGQPAPSATQGGQQQEKQVVAASGYDVEI
jgi:hypothetical protein